MRTAVIADTAINGAIHNPAYADIFDDPETELWGMNMLFTLFPWWHRWFEIHLDYLIDAPANYKRFLSVEHQGRPIYMLRKEPDVPASVTYPLAEVIQGVSGAYFTSSRAYMVALAIHERFERIVVLGTGEVQPERSIRSNRNVAFWLGVAAGRGIEIVPDAREGALRSYAGDAADILYGYRLPIGDAVDYAAIDRARQGIIDQGVFRWSEDAELGR